jgi:transcriptional regulator with XRE-family HTH domain
MLKGWGDRLKEARGGNTLVVWCVLVGISRSVWIDYEKERRSPTLETLLRISEKSGKSVHWIVTGEKPPEGLDFNILVQVIQAIEEEVPDIDSASKAKLVLRLYNDQALKAVKQATEDGRFATQKAS